MGGHKKVHKTLHDFAKGIRTWQLVLILVLLLFLSATLLRFDHLRMVELRDQVFAADEAGDNEQLAAALRDLQDFTLNNIVINITEENGNQKVSFGTGPFYLENSYRRAAAAAIAKAEATAPSDDNPYGNIYSAASAVCRPQAIAGGWAWTDQRYLDCFTNELAKYPSSEDLITTLMADVPPSNLYRYDYASPILAPTPAGFVILVSLIIFVVILTRFFIWLILKIALFFLKIA